MRTISAQTQRLQAGSSDGAATSASWQGTGWRDWEQRAAIDADLLERLARIARGLPGHVISVDADDRVEAELSPPTTVESDPVVRIDGVVARDILEHYQQLLELG